MKKSSLLVLFLVVVFVFPVSNAFSQNRVIHISSDKDTVKRNGLLYALPLTIIKVDITVKKIETIKGPYAVYANKFLGLKNVIYSNHTKYKINKVNISTYSQPDPDHFYLVEHSKSKKSKNRMNLTLNLTESGLIHNVNADIPVMEEEESFETVGNGVDEFPDIFKYYADDNLFEQIDTVIETYDMDTITIEKQVLKKTLVEKSLEQRAREAAEYIIKLKQNRFNLLSGYQEVPYGEGAVEYMNEHLENLENEYLKLFTGLTFTKELHYSFTYIPELSGEIKSEMIFRFSDRYGILDKSKTLGENVLITIERAGYTREMSSYVNKRIGNRKSAGIVYRIPEYAKVSINYGGNILTCKRIPISQFGVVTSLPIGKSKVIFYPETGAIKSVSIED